MARKRLRADQWRPVFLDALRNTCNVRAAGQAAGISRQAAYKNREKSPAFAAAWDHALDDGLDVLFAVAHERARQGDNRVLMFLIKTHTARLNHDRVPHVATGSDEHLIPFTVDFGPPAGEPAQRETANNLTPERKHRRANKA